MSGGPIPKNSGPENPAATVPLPQQQQLTLEQAMVLASQHQEAGRLAQAESLLKEILRVQPKFAPALHLLGVVAHGAGRADLAAELVLEAIKSGGQEVALFHANLCEMCRQLGRFDDAVKYGRRAVELDRKMAQAHGNLGIAWYDRGEFEKAAYCHGEALKIAPGFAPSLNNLGSIAREKKDDAAAADYYRRAIAANPRYAEPRNNLGATLVRMELLDEALETLNHAIAQNPGYAEAVCNRGFAFLAREQFDPAAADFARALQLKPGYAEAWLGIARLRDRCEDFDGALAATRQAIAYDGEMAEAHATLGGILMTTGDPLGAKAAYLRALELDGSCSSAKLGLGNLQAEAGDFDAAEISFRQAMSSTSERLGGLFSILQMRKIKAGDPLIAEVEGVTKDFAALPEKQKLIACFALGKMHDDLGNFERAFPYFIEGCRLKRAKLDYDADTRDRLFENTASVFSREFIGARSGMGFDSDVPVFVVGMPRSGTTLTEQIIASHPDAFGAGEIYDLLKVAATGGEFPGNTASANLREMGKQYASGLLSLAPGKSRVTDKMPVNFMKIGLIHLILPKAKIIHVERHPLDTCVSCFTRLFSHNQNQTYDLYELGRFYRAYHKLMAHWRNVLPPGSFLDLRYEDLVANTETESRKLVEFCGLEWNDACLSPHETSRNIRTASVAQVRQPVYKTSVGRWRKYEKFLGPLIDGLGEVLDGYAVKNDIKPAS